MTRASVSVALCTHNGARFIREQVESILAQTRPADEVVLSDDASTDDTVAIVETVWRNHGESAPALHVIRNPEVLGVTRNFEQAVRRCTSDLIALSDQDDVWRADRLDGIASVFEQRPALDFVFTDARLVDDAGVDLGISLFGALEISAADLEGLRSGKAFAVLLRRNLATGATVVFRRRLLEQALPFDEAWVHDEWLAIVAAAISELDWIAEPTIGYRQHGANQIGVKAPTLGYKLRRLVEPRRARNASLAARAIALAARLERLDLPEPTMTLMRGKVRHERVRSTLPALRIARVSAILREARAGGYTRFSSQGRLDMARDLLQPDR